MCAKGTKCPFYVRTSYINYTTYFEIGNFYHNHEEVVNLKDQVFLKVYFVFLSNPEIVEEPADSICYSFPEIKM